MIPSAAEDLPRRKNPLRRVGHALLGDRAVVHRLDEFGPEDRLAGRQVVAGHGHLREKMSRVSTLNADGGDEGDQTPQS